MKDFITIGVITYNGRNVLPLCLESIYEQTYPHYRLVVIDNASTDGTSDWLKTNYPDLSVIKMLENRGPNPARNVVIKSSTSRLILLVDDDAVLHPDCLYNLYQAAHDYPDAAVWSPRIVYYDQPNLIQFEGVYLHYTCEAILLNGDTPITYGLGSIMPIQVAGGVSYLLDRDKAQQIGLFDEDYFFGRTDGEFTYRLSLAGYKLYTVPNAICLHRVKIRGLSKVFYQIRNRWDMILKCYSARTLLFISPALIVYEVALILFMLKQSQLKGYLKAMHSVLTSRHQIIKKRCLVQSLRRTKDKDLLFAHAMNIRNDLIQSRLEARLKDILDRFFHSYWHLIIKLL
jgi:GT2 family glycosyltransferase